MEFVKICGLKNIKDIKLCADKGSTAIGFIYNVPESPRNLSRSEIYKLMKKIPKKIVTVIVSKPSNISDIENIIRDIRADYYQIHINFNSEELDKLSSESKRKIIFALKATESNKELIIKMIEKKSNQFFAFLIDNSEGHGAQFNFNIISEILSQVKKKNIILAGGIDIENVEKIIRILQPFGIDVSSSLERERGVKDTLKIKEFLEKVSEIKLNIGE